MFTPLRGKFETLKKKTATIHMPQEYIAAGQQLVADLSGTFTDATALLTKAAADSAALLQSFFEDPATSKPAEFFGGLARFMGQFDAERKEIIRKNEEEARKAKLAQPAARGGKARGPVDLRGQQRGVMDDLLA
jgi:hypothetical protein